jgi:toxin ParE1/3/4
MKIRWTVPATRQLTAAFNFIAEDSDRAARKTATKIWKAANILRRHPAAGRKGRIGGTRELVVRGTPFVVAYRVRKTDVEILAVWHAARKWPEDFE